MNLEGNELSGFIPPSVGSIEVLQEIHLGNNILNGNFPQSLMGLHGAPGQPQRCRDVQMFRTRSDNERYFGQCIFRPVPRFEAVGSTPSLVLRATRAQGQNKTDTKEILLMVHGAASEGGIKGAWLENGLGLPADQLRTRCGTPAPCTTGCTTIWREESSACTVLNESHITITVKQTSDGFALLNVTAQVLGLSDGVYDFIIHLPVPYANNEHTANISGTFTINGAPICRPGAQRVALGADGAEQCLDCEAGMRS